MGRFFKVAGAFKKVNCYLLGWGIVASGVCAGLC